MGMLALTSSIEKARSGVPSAAAWNRASSDAGELIVRSQIAGRAVAFYAQKLVVPFPISISYPRWQTPRDVEQFRTFAADRAKAEARRPDVAPGSVLSYAFPVLVAGALIASWLLRDRLGRGQFVAVAGFVLLLAPSLGFIDLGWMRYTFVSNHAAYLASVPFLAGIAWLGGTLLARANDRTVTVSSAGIVIVICAILSLMISLRFRNPSYFWVQNARAFATFRSWLPRYELAASLIDERDPSGQKQAMQAADEIIDDLRPEEPGPLVVRGILKQRRGDEVGAFADFERSMQTFPTYAPAFFEAGNAFSRRADLRPTDPLPRLTAMQLFQEAAARDPLDAWSRVRLGQTRWEIARRLDWQDPSRDTFYDKAAEALDEAVQLRAYDVDLLVTVSETLVEMRRLGEAGRFLESARSIDPSRAETYVVLGDAFLAGGNATGTEASLRTAIGLSPRFVIARLRLAALHQMQGRWNEARDQLTRVLELNPDHAEAKRRLAEIEAAATTRPSL
jgi:tetratricopeptide (TPR) repeat protein